MVAIRTPEPAACNVLAEHGIDQSDLATSTGAVHIDTFLPAPDSCPGKGLSLGSQLRAGERFW